MRPFNLSGIVLLAAVLLGAGGPVGCSSPKAPRIRHHDRVVVAVVIPEGSGVGLQQAARDLAVALATITGVSHPAEVVEGDIARTDAKVVVAAEVSGEADDGGECFRIRVGKVPEEGGEKEGIEIRATSEVGAMYGIYRLVMDLGVRYFHPEETFFPDDPDARLPWHYDGEDDCPRFGLRGFHEHTQHPIVMSDFLLRPDRQEFRDYLSRYLHWLARNRQNALSFHLLKTVDLGSWIPYINEVIEEARLYGVRVGPVVSFADQQQNSYKLLGEGGELLPEEERITQGLDELMTAGFDFMTFQIGTSEFTKPDDESALSRLNTAVGHLESLGVPAYAWIHITCSLKDDRGGYFYHLPLEADSGLGALVHTTMFYTLGHPAPVYDCEDFTHQVAFMEQVSGERELVFFPETAWWLGFDNNLPLALPVTGWSRAYDIRQVLPGFEVDGHLTFTTGREWTYWQYDHFLTRITWDGDLDWVDYLDWVAPMYGRHGEKAAYVLKDWTELQRKHFYEENPLIYFYLAGELPQDEIGAQAGILARRPKLAFRELVRFDDEELAAWRAQDFEMLESMREDYRELLDVLPAKLESGSPLQQKLYHELHTALWVYVKRIEHAVALYVGAVAVRDWDREVRQAVSTDPPREPSQDIRAALLAEANQKLSDAKAISAEVIAALQTMEADYRYPVELLCREKPESLTVYPFGYLYETSSGYFWTRRDDQLEALVARTFQTVEEEWSTTPEVVFFTDRDHTEMLQPESEIAADAIKGFIPRLLFALSGYDETAGTVTVFLAQDYNENGLPDPGTEQSVTMENAGARWEGAIPVYTILVHDSAGCEMGELAIIQPAIRLEIQVEAGQVSNLVQGELEGEVAGQALVEMVVSVGGIDAEGAAALIKAIYGIPAGEDLPATLPFAFGMTYQRVED